MGQTLNRLIRSASLTGFADLARAGGADPTRLAKAAGVPLAALTNPDLKLDSRGVSKLLELAAEQTSDPCFGLRLAESRRLSNLGPVGLITRDQPTLRKALGIMRQYMWLHNEAITTSLEETGDLALLHLDIAAHVPSPRQSIELCVGVLCANLRALLGPRWRPEAASFRHSAPTDLSVHQRVFGRTPRFLQDFNGLVLPRSDLDTPLADADPAMAQQVMRYIEALARERPATTRIIVGELILLMLPTGACSADRIASHLGIDRRTLHRRLAAEDLNFRTLLDDQRAHLAQALLQEGRTCTATAELAGFSSVSTFSHWFARRFHEAPRDYQKKLATTRTR